MDFHDLKVLTVIGASALTGMGLSSVLYQRFGEVEGVESVVTNGAPQWAGRAPRVEIRWWQNEAPIRFSGSGSIEIGEMGRNSVPSIWKRPPARTGLGNIPSLFRPSRSKWEREVSRMLRSAPVSPPHQREEEGAGKPR
jgi:hypothetical protein